MHKLYVHAAIAFGFVCQAQSFTQVTVSTGAPLGLEEKFIASATQQYLGAVTANPLAAHTYTLKLYGPNPAYDPPPTNKELVDALVTVDSYTYANGWGDGESYQRYVESTILSNYAVNCSSPTFWKTPIDPVTCQTIMGVALTDLYDQLLSTPTIVPGEFQ